jgi:cyclohexanone monooxygenase
LAADTLDLDALRAKYREERDKRLEVKDRGKYIYLEGELAERYDSDPWAPTDGARDPVSRELEVVVVGGGFAGMLAAGNLRKHGVPADQLCIVDRGSDFGGTWYWNRYPGLSCDTESFCYLPLLEETGYVPRQKYAMGPEIFEHSQRVGHHFGLYDKALFQTRVTGAEWDEDTARWVVTTDRGDELRTRYLFLCGGGTNRPKLPGIPGIADFKGHSFHTMRWDYGYTGGGPEGNLTGLADKRVGLIGTGCTAIQAVGPLGASAKELYVFQRTPSAVATRDNRPTEVDWFKSLEPGWQMERMENFLNIVSGTPQAENLVDDGWTWNFENLKRLERADTQGLSPEEFLERADFAHMEKLRARVEATVTHPQAAEALKPWYGAACKRPTFHDGYLDTFNRPNVTLVDTNGRGVERITERGAIANGREYELDCIIFATGFDTLSGIAKNWGFYPKGVGGETLTERWARDFTTLHGLQISGFPNMFVIGSFQGVLSATLTYSYAVQTEQCARIVGYCRDRGIDRVEAKWDAEQAWKAELAARRPDVYAYFEACTPGYINLEGGGGVVWQDFFGGSAVEYRRIVNAWFDNELEKDLDLRRSGEAA